jgi:hypothetical protein
VRCLNSYAEVKVRYICVDSRAWNRSTSCDVCELWDGRQVVRTLGSPDILELVYDEVNIDLSACLFHYICRIPPSFVAD